MFGKVKLKVDQWDELDYHLGIVEEPPETTASLGLLDQSHRTITRNILHAKRVIFNHFKVIV